MYFILFEVYEFSGWNKNSCIIELDNSLLKENGIGYLKSEIRKSKGLHLVTPLTILDIKHLDI